MQELHPTSDLIYGCEIISKGLRVDLSPMGTLFRFDSGSPTRRPKPLTLLKVVALFLINVVLLIMGYLSLKGITTINKADERFMALPRSAFLVLYAKMISLYRVVVYMAIGMVTVAQHCSIANVVANRNYIIRTDQQSRIAKSAFVVILSKNIVSVGSLIFIVSHLLEVYNWQSYLVLSGLLCVFVLNVNVYAPVMYSCYLGAALGKHVENFSEIYIDTMFDQFMSAIEAQDPELARQAAALNPTISGSGSGAGNDADDKQNSSGGSRRFIMRCCGGSFALVRRIFAGLRFRIGAIVVHLNARKYPELPEMKMTKLSSTASLKISDSIRVANSQLIRARLRKTQIMLSELRDMVNDINKISSPIIMMLIIMDTLIMILVATVSIQAKLFKSINMMIIPTVCYTINVIIGVVYACTCLDETSSQLKLMTNKLFDFIIMNYRVQSQSGKHCINGANSNSGIGSTGSRHQLEREMSRFGCGGDSVEEEALSETWSQFQYTRKLANTIQFTMGGILTVTRRLALPILGHILSAVFISIEVMSIIDTSGHEEIPTSGSKRIIDADKVRFLSP